MGTINPGGANYQVPNTRESQKHILPLFNAMLLGPPTGLNTPLSHLGIEKRASEKSVRVSPQINLSMGEGATGELLELT